MTQSRRGIVSPRLVAVENAWLGGEWTGPCLLRFTPGGLVLEPDAPVESSGEIVARIPGAIMPGFTDSHVHLGLIDPTRLVPGGIARVCDLGAAPHRAAQWQVMGELNPDAPLVEFAGAFLTAIGGYPAGRSWAPQEVVRQFSTPATAQFAIDEQVRLGASFIKIALNSESGPVWPDDLLRIVVGQSHAAELPVVAHAEGLGQAMRAVRSGVDRLAHTPWSERLSDDDLLVMAGRCSWISTLDIHGWGDYSTDYETAADNLRRFHGFGGRVSYGTDLGNGPLPVGINIRELTSLAAAGLDRDELVAALAPATAQNELGSRISWIAGPLPGDPAETPHWLSTASVVPVESITEVFS